MITPASLRLDLKCGRGSISQNETCHVGKAEAVEPKKKKSNRPKSTKFNLGESVLMYAGVATTAAGVGGFAYNLGKGLANEFSANKSGSSKKYNRTLKFRQQRQISSSIGSAGFGLIGASLAAKGARTKDRGAQSAGTRFLVAGTLGSVASGLGAQDTARERRNLLLEVKGYRRKKNRYKGYEEEFKRRYSRSAGSSSRSSGRTRTNTSVKDPFKDLNVDPNASDADVKAAWKKAIIANHPDRGGDPEKAKAINAAFEEIMRRRGKLDSIYADGFDIDWASITI